MTFEEFERAVEEAGLRAQQRHATLWQIKGGIRLVYCWPTKWGLRYQSEGRKSTVGSVEDAIKLAGPWAKPIEDEPLPPPWSSPAPRVGLIRTIWRWLW